MEIVHLVLSLSLYLSHGNSTVLEVCTLFKANESGPPSNVSLDILTGVKHV